MATQDQIYYNLQEDLALSVVALNNARARLARTTDPAERAEIERFIRDTTDYITGLQQQLSARARESAGQVVKDDQTGRVENASPTNPPPGPLVADDTGRVRPAVTPTPSNAQRAPVSGEPGAAQDSGLNDPVKRQSQTQATPSNLPAPGAPSPNNQDQVAAQTAGVAAAGDDVRATVNVLFGGDEAKIITQDNVLDRYASYTYSISIYLMSPTDYARLIRTKQKNLAGYNLLIQSAGIPLSTGFGRQPDVADVGEVPGITTFSLDQGRNEFFQEDFYIDDVNVRSLISGKGSQGPHNVATLDFKIIEPNGITLLPRLYKAVQKYVAGEVAKGDQNYAAQNYLMVIKFYGYDDQGDQYLPIKGVRLDARGQPVTTPQVIEKFIPFQFRSIKFRVANKITEYSCEAVAPQNLIATGPARGTIPYPVEITSKTLQELFNGPVAFSSPARTGTAANQTEAETQRLQRQANPSGTAPAADQTDAESARLVRQAGAPSTTNVAPPKASAASTPTITQGLAQALNDFQEQLVDEGKIEVADKYYIELLTPALQNAKVVPPGSTNQRKVPMGPGPGAPANQQKNPATQSQNKDASVTSTVPGMSIMQFIDQYVRTSTYIYDQQIRIIDPKTGRPLDVGTPAAAVAWYRVGIQTVPKLSAGYDRIRNDYAYDITYQISPYKVNDVQSDFFPPPKFQGTHKKYNYWFTGENTQVLRFEQDFNYLYYLTINTQPGARQAPGAYTTDYREYLKKYFSPRSAQSSQGQPGAVNEPSANAADYLYSPADQGRVSLEILGDPAWIKQGELWAGVAGAGQTYGPFLDDGTINFESQEALFEIAFNQPVDYNLDTGLMDPTTKNFDKTDTSAGSARQSYVYRAREVTSKFSQGRFTQELHGVLLLFDLPQQRQQQSESNVSDVGEVPGVTTFGTDAETRRLQQSATRNTNQAAQNAANRTAGLPTPIESPAPGLLEQEGFPSGALPAQPPTSSGQVIGTANTPTSIFGQYGATGIGTGSPAVTFTTQTGRIVVASSPEDISAAFNAGFINRVVANELTRQLNTLQQQANAPVQNQPSQTIAREP